MAFMLRASISNSFCYLVDSHYFLFLNAVWHVQIGMVVWCYENHPQIMPYIPSLDMTRPAGSRLDCKHWYVYNQVLVAVFSFVIYKAFKH